MATPTFNAMHLRFSNRLNDAVGSAASDGDIFSSVERERYMNQANNFIQTTIFYGIGSAKARTILQSLLKTQAITFASAGVAVATDYNNMPVALTKDASTLMFSYWPRKEELDNNVHANVQNAFTVELSKIYTYEAGVILNAGTGVLRYIQKDQITTDGATDIALSSQFHDTVIDIAVSYALEEIGEMESASAYMQRVSSILSFLKGQS